MKRRKLNIFNNIATFISFLISTISGLLLLDNPGGHGLRGGGGAIADQSLFGIGPHDWSGIHTISSIICVILVALHIALHWYWVKRLPEKFGADR